MKALISPNETASYISSWTLINNVQTPVLTYLKCRIAEVSETDFAVSEPLYWIDCADTVNATIDYFDVDTQTITALPQGVPKPLL